MTYPTLSETGWVVGIRQKADTMFAHYLTANHSQSYVFRGAVKSMAYDIQNAKNNTLDVKDNVTNSLRSLYGSAFTILNLDVTVTDIPSIEDGLQLKIYLSIQDTDGQSVTLSEAINYSNGKTTKIANLNNNIQASNV